MQRSGKRECLLEIWGQGNAEATGEPNPPDVKIRDVWASLIPVRGRERETDTGRQSLTTYMANLDYLDGRTIDETMTVRFGSQTFNIVAVKIDHSTRKTVDLELSEQKYGA